MYVLVHFYILLHVTKWALTNRHIHTSKWPLNTLANKNERALPNDILAQCRGDYRLQLAVKFSSVFAFISHWDAHVMTLHEVTGCTWQSRRMTCNLPWTMLQRRQVLMTSHPLVLFYTYTFTFYVRQNLSIIDKAATYASQNTELGGIHVMFLRSRTRVVFVVLKFQPKWSSRWYKGIQKINRFQKI